MGLLSNNTESAKVAIYWDFENLHAVLADKQYGPGAYRENRFKEQPVFVDLAPIIEYAASFGDIIINRAYANWQWFSAYREALNGLGIDLIQFFPRGANMKNSADIRMALDALSDIHTHPHLTHIVIISSDSDFISLAQKVKQAGRFIAGVGVEGSCNRFWSASCNEFKFYDSLLPKTSLATTPETLIAETAAQSANSDVENAAPPSMEEARDALSRALMQTVDRNGVNYVARSSLKVLIKRLLPSFDEKALNCVNFSDFLNRFPEIVTVVDNLSGGHVALTSYAEAVVEDSSSANTATELDDSQANHL